MLNVECCRTRLNRFKVALEARRVDVAILSNPRTVYYLTGHLREEEFPQLLVILPNRRTILITDSPPVSSAADEVSTYESYSIDWPVSFAGILSRAAAALESSLAPLHGLVASLGIERERLNSVLFELITRRWQTAEIRDMTPVICELRRRKDDDEIKLIQKCVKAIEAGYVAARQVLRPGTNELEVFNAVHGEIVKAAGCQLKVSGDYACGVRAIRGGDTPIDREIEAGDLCILDIYPSLYGYHGDLCRTFAASEPTDLQFQAWEIASDALVLAKQNIRPGVRASEVWSHVRDFIDGFEFVRESFWHHLGHGIGLDPQEAPWIIPGTDHVFEEGDVIALEPGCYAPALQGGVRLESNYIVRGDGLEDLSEFPYDLTETGAVSG
jgi:Xaa-Pro aminopeptidase